MKRIYIAGPMTGLPGWNFPAFDDAADRLHGQRDVVIINPADNFGRQTDLPRWRYISKSLDQINALARVSYAAPGSECMIIVLDGWQNSSGARLEVEAAHQLGLDIYQLECVLDPHWESSCRIIPGGLPPHPEAAVPSAPVANPNRVTVEDETPVRAQVLAEASGLICRDRNNQYGPPGKDFNRIANILTSLGYGKESHDSDEFLVLDDHDVSVIMIALKLSRIMWSPQKRDSWIDVAGYAGCGAEVAGADE